MEEFQRTVQLVDQPRVAIQDPRRSDDLASKRVGGDSIQCSAEAVVIQDFTGIDVFSPIRSDCCDGTENYQRQSNQAK